MFLRASHFPVLIVVAILSLAHPVAKALDSSELALIVNRNMPDGLKLAELYAKVRQVPENRIIELDLPQTEQMTFEDYEQKVVPPVREFLRLNDPQRHIKCLVTFYGVPFRINAHVDTPQELLEISSLRAQLKQTSDKLHSLVEESEKMALSMDITFTPAASEPSIIPADPAGQLDGKSIDALARRLDHAGKAMMAKVQGMTDPDQRQNSQIELEGLVQRFNAPVEIDAGQSTAPSPSSPIATSESVSSTVPLEDRRFDPVARDLIRRNTAKSAGLFGYTKLLLAQIAYLAPEDSEAATDSELSMLWWTFYPRAKWQLNLLCYRFGGGGRSPSLMVSRLDAPKPETVREIIVDSAHAEAIGLQGKAVIDARGLPLDGPNGKPDPYAIYDDSLRRLAALLRLKTTLPVTLDDNPAVLPPHSVQDVAVYCGWYSVGKYVPACSFVPGAVGYHLASYEMVSLRDPGNTGWVRGLLNDGIAATIGPVSEPYLQSFPPPDEFFPLLLTGRLSLAEVFWKTEVMASWRMCLVGDPLYVPFKVHPQLKIEDLPPKLQLIFAAAKPASRP